MQGRKPLIKTFLRKETSQLRFWRKKYSRQSWGNIISNSNKNHNMRFFCTFGAPRVHCRKHNPWYCYQKNYIKQAYEWHLARINHPVALRKNFEYRVGNIWLQRLGNRMFEFPSWLLACYFETQKKPRYGRPKGFFRWWFLNWNLIFVHTFLSFRKDENFQRVECCLIFLIFF